MKALTILSLLLISFLSLPVVQAQIDKGALVKGTTVTSEIRPSEVHRYKLSLEKDQFVYLKLVQQGVDVRVVTYDPKGAKMEAFDSPNGKYGNELFSLISDKKGTYTVAVLPFDDKEPVGTYELGIEIMRPRATSVIGQIDETFAFWNAKDSPGAAVAVVKDGEIVLKKGYGSANLEYDIPVRSNTVFHIASVSKQFTVFSILLLEKQGKLTLDDDIRNYIPEVPDFGKTITLRHLASHTSGLRDQWNLLSMAGWRMDDVITKEHVLKLVSKQKELNFGPGEEYAYSNTGFTLLAEVVSRVSGMSFAAFTKSSIFDPLGMENTLFYEDHEQVVQNRAYSYHSDGPGYKKSVLSYAVAGATSLFTTVEDLALWSINFSEPKVGDASIFKKMNTPVTLNNGKTFGGGLGQFIGTYKGLNEIQHGGADAGYRSYLTRFPDENLSVMVFSNAAEFNPEKMAHEVVDIYLKDTIAAAKSKEEEKEKGTSETVTVDASILRTYVGDFEIQPGFNVTIGLVEGNLSATATGQPSMALMPLSETEFKMEDVPAKIEFIPNGGENVVLLKLYQGGIVMDAPRVIPFDADAVELSDFSGAFFSEELSTTYHFEVVEGKLMAKHSRLSDFDLSPVQEDVFAGNAWFFGKIEFVRDANAAITGFKVSNGRVKNLRFEKVL